MVYMGGKQKIAKFIVPYINSFIKDNQIENFYDVFCGGGNICCNIICPNIYASDISPTLIALHQKAQSDFSSICTDSSREQWDRCYTEYKRLKLNGFKDPQIPLDEIGAIEWLACYNGRGFPGGYGIKTEGRNFFETRLKNLEDQSKLEAYKKIQFSCQDYTKVEIKPNSIIYADSPYKGSKPYGINPKFAYYQYYDWLMETAKTTPIFISEQYLPDTIPYKIIWQKEVKRTVGQNVKNFKAIETLFFLDLR